ncbi:MAG: hypothetical protein ACXWC1_30795 [Burkholderiales bacterium]
MAVGPSPNIERVRAVLSGFITDEHGIALRGPIVDYPYDVARDVRLGKLGKSGERVARNLNHARRDLGNITTLLNRLEWTRAECLKGHLPVGSWAAFAELDVEHFHVEMRSALDYVAKAIGAAAGKSGQVRDGSFNKLSKWIEGDKKNRRRLGEDLAALVDEAPWFPSVKGIRDAIVHNGANSAVFFQPEEGISFQVHGDQFTNLVRVGPELLVNPNVVDFQLYSAWLITELISYLGRVAAVLGARVPGNKISSNTRYYCSGFRHFIAWSNRLIAVLERPSPSESFG